ncbi:MAG: chemotaxis-specific protein-glutamate methyltransferase CheB [Chloroflexi bacterium]|nr:chemotaxis-specific protein-glutamate methyltransferase CheB [Chloroflexota bacterium]MDL1882396.1 chemotaxis-specific protein-glutamate methyltransferase CheB [Anaerolineae bacterium CFX8]
MNERVIRVLVAEDSPTVRHHLAGIINETPGLTVIGEARDGREVIELAQALQPDVISMDIRMPGIDGLEATRQIMTLCPMPIVVVSGLVDEDIDLAFRALQAGALAVVGKPTARSAPDFAARQRQLAHTLAAMAGVRVIRRWERPPGQNGADTGRLIPPAAPTAPAPEIIAIGASAGGPGALSILLAGLPTLPVPVVIVQHMPDEFMPGLARWLDKTTPLTVQIAADGDTLKPGTVYLSPGRAHLAVRRQGATLASALIHEQGIYRYQPAVDVLFQSVAAACGAAAVGVVLTGMGEDGADGLLAMRRAGARTFAQDRASCTVFGMPAAAIQRGAAEQVLPLKRLPGALLRLAK